MLFRDEPRNRLGFLWHELSNSNLRDTKIGDHTLASLIFHFNQVNRHACILEQVTTFPIWEQHLLGLVAELLIDFVLLLLKLLFKIFFIRDELQIRRIRALFQALLLHGS